MSSQPPDFDPYHEWLDIEPFKQPVDHYRLLGLARFETDLRRIQQAADDRMALVRSFQMGPRGASTQKLLNELAAARVCLLTAATKEAYDAQLAQHWMELDAAQRAMPEPPPVAAQPKAIGNSDDDMAEPLRLRGKPFVLASATLLAVLLAVGALLRTRPLQLVANRSQKSSVQVKARIQPSRERRPTTILPGDMGDIVFHLETALLRGDVRRETIAGRQLLTDWTASHDAAEWDFRVQKPGYFKVELEYATSGVDGDRELVVQVDQRSKVCSLQTSGGLTHFVTDSHTVAVSTSGLHTLTIRPGEHPRGNWFVLRSVRFIPVGATVTP
jgi:hypothetical protein